MFDFNPIYLMYLLIGVSAAMFAEGIEQPEERDVLVELGCDLLQGYRFGRPSRPFVEPVW